MKHTMLKRSLCAAIFGCLPLTGALAEEMDHSKHQMDHSKHQMDHSQHMQHDTGMAEHMHHQHGAGAWMFELRHMSMNMSGMRDGTSDLDTADFSGTMMGTPNTVAMGKDYMMSPTSMRMDMEMLMAMYGITDSLSVMAMFNYLKNDMNMIMHMPMMGTSMTSNMKTEGLGDTFVAAMYKLNRGLMASFGVSIPTGSIDEKVKMMGVNMGDPLREVTAPYAMQLGSGTYDLKPSITYKGGMDTWGAQATYTYRLSENDNDWNLGNRIDASVWSKTKLDKNTFASLRLALANWDKVDDSSPAMTAMSPAFDPEATGGTRVDVLAGISAMSNAGVMLGLEIGLPVYQDLNGPQMKTTSLVNASVQWMF